MENTDSLPSLGDAHDHCETTPMVATRSAGPWPRNHKRHTVLLLCALLTVMADFGGGLTLAPEVRLLELSVCRAYYASRDPNVIGPPPLGRVDEKYCKLSEIQVSLAYLRAWKRVLETIPGLLLTIPYGRLADRWGRKPILLLGMTGQVLSYLWMLLTCYFYRAFPPESVMLGSLFLLIGGGFRVLTAALNSMIVDVCTSEERSTVFYTFGAVIHITDVIAPPLGSWFLSQDVWLPFKFSTPFLLLSFLVILALPETLDPSERRIDYRVARNDGRNIRIKAVDALRSAPQIVKNLYTRTLSRNGVLLGCFGLVFTHSIATQSGSLLLQFASKRLGWPIARAGYLLSTKAVCAIIVLMLLIPTAKRWSGKTTLQPRRISSDTIVCEISLFLLATGNILTGCGANGVLLVIGTVLTSCGTAFPQALQGILGSLAQQRGSSTASIYAGQAFLELSGTLIGSLLMAATFDLGANMGHGAEWWLGLPFWTSAVLFTGALFAAACLAPALVATSDD